MTLNRRYTPVEWGGFLAASLVTALGATMVIAWLQGLVELLRLANPGPTMRFNSAVLLVLCGVALLCNIEQRPRWAIGVSSVAFLFALVCASSSLSLIDVDSDTLLFDPEPALTAKAGVGRTAFGTSLGVILLSASIVARHLLRHGAVVASLLGIVVCTLSWVAINRYLMGTDFMVGWPVTTGMALTTALALFALGAAIIALAFDQPGAVASSRWLAYPLAFAFAAASFMIWRELIDTETMHLKRQTDSAAIAVRLQIRERLSSRLKAVSRFAQRWGSLDRELYHKDGRRLLDDFDGILALNWITNDQRVGWLCSRENGPDLVGKPLPPGARHEAIRQAQTHGGFFFTPVLELLHGELGFIGYVPTRNAKNELTGSVAAVFRLEAFLSSVADDRRHVGFNFRVRDNGREVFADAKRPTSLDHVTANRRLDLRGLDWQIEVWPTAETVAASYTRVPDMALAKGLLTAVLLGVAIQLRQRAAERAAEVQRTAEARRDSEQRFDLAVNGSQDGIWEWRTGTETFYGSSRYREILGYPQGEEGLSFEEWFTRIAPEDAARIHQAIDAHVRDRVPYDVITRFLTFRNEWIWIRIRGHAAWDEHGVPVRMAGSITDITAEREAERQLLQHVDTIAASNRILIQLAEAAEAAADAKATFLRNMSHELRTPLNSIIGFSTGLLRHANSHALDDHQRDRIERIVASGRHLLELVNNVLEISKAEAGDHSQQVESIDLPALFDELSAMVESLLQKKPAVRLLPFIDVDDSPLVLDRTRLKQILLNLLSNAVKFTDHGTIILGASCVAGHWRFSVADTGIGIPAGDQRRIFENFEQVHSPGRKLEGTGLGLSICATLAAGMQGHITLESQPGVGSTFTLDLPPGGVASRADAATCNLAPTGRPTFATLAGAQN